MEFAERTLPKPLCQPIEMCVNEQDRTPTCELLWDQWNATKLHGQAEWFVVLPWDYFSFSRPGPVQPGDWAPLWPNLVSYLQPHDTDNDVLPHRGIFYTMTSSPAAIMSLSHGKALLS